MLVILVLVRIAQALFNMYLLVRPEQQPERCRLISVLHKPERTTLALYGYCGTTKCDSCKVYFKVDCPVDSSCCQYNITVSNPTTTQTTLAAPAATIVNSTFNISGPPGNLFTEMRARSGGLCFDK